MVDGIEGTADFVQHAAKQADRIASKRRARRRDARRDPARLRRFPWIWERRVPDAANERSRSRRAGPRAPGKTRSPLRKPGSGRVPLAGQGGGQKTGGEGPLIDDGDEWGWQPTTPPGETSSVARCPPRWRTSAASWSASRSETASLREELRGARSALAAAADEAEGLVAVVIVDGCSAGRRSASASVV